jgi:hypothetical protein
MWEYSTPLQFAKIILVSQLLQVAGAPYANLCVYMAGETHGQAAVVQQPMNVWAVCSEAADTAHALCVLSKLMRVTWQARHTTFKSVSTSVETEVASGTTCLLLAWRDNQVIGLFAPCACSTLDTE